MKMGKGQILTKSKFVEGMKCPKLLWLKEHGFGDVETIMDPRMLEGIEVGKLAHKLFADITVIPYSRNRDIMLNATKEAMDNGATSIAEAAFAVENLFCRVDILQVKPDGLVINEVKAVTSVRHERTASGIKDECELEPEFLRDVGFQYFVLKEAGYNIKATNLIYLDKNYKMGETLEPSKLFKIDDATDEILEYYLGQPMPLQKKINGSVKAEIDFLSNYLQGDNEKDEMVKQGCKKGTETCAMWHICGANLPSPNVWDLCGNGKKELMYKNGLWSFEELRNCDNLNQNFSDQIEVFLTGQPIIKKEKIKDFLDTLWYPLYFLDFEAFNNAIPVYEGQWPYEQVTFQYSLDYFEHPGDRLLHKEFLGKEGEDPRRAIAEALVANIPKDACVTVYNATFESTRLKELAEMFPDLREHLLRIDENLRDFDIPFQKHYYLTKEMHGKYSIKYVLPALFPDDPFLNYKQLPGAKNGLEANDIYLSLSGMDYLECKKQRLYLLRYCGLDTFAMVKVYEALLEVTSDELYQGVSNANEEYIKERLKHYEAEDEEIDKELYSAFY